MRQLVLRTKILWKVALGVYLVKEYYDNGDIEEYESFEGLIILPSPLWFYQ